MRPFLPSLLARPRYERLESVNPDDNALIYNDVVWHRGLLGGNAAIKASVVDVSVTDSVAQDATRTTQRDLSTTYIESFEPEFTLMEKVWDAFMQTSLSLMDFCNEGAQNVFIRWARICLIVADGPVDIVVGLSLFLRGFKKWALVCAMCCCAPHIALYISFTRLAEPAQAFHDAFGFQPSALGLVMAHHRTLQDYIHGKPTPANQCYKQLIVIVELLESLPWSLCQIAICWQQGYFKIELLNPYIRLLCLAQSLMCMALILIDLKESSSLSGSSDVKSYIYSLLLLGKSGLAPPELIKDILHQRHIVSYDSLRSLSVQGMFSIAKAVRRSRLLEEIIFYDSGLDELQEEAGSYRNGLDVGLDACFSHFLWTITLNSGRLRFVAFCPSLNIAEGVWTKVTGNITNTRLRSIQNGEYAWSAPWEEVCWPLRAVCEKDCPVAVKQYLQKRMPGSINLQHMLNACLQLDRVECLKRLLIDVPRLVEKNPTALATAARWGSRRVAQLLIHARADPNVSADSCNPPLASAAINGHNCIVHDLLQRGAKVDIVNHIGRTPLMLAAMHNDNGYQIVKILLDARANVNHQDKTGSSVLHYSSQGCGNDILSLLLRQGADRNLLNHERVPAHKLDSN